MDRTEETNAIKLYLSMKFMLRSIDEGIDNGLIKYKLKRDMGIVEKKLRHYMNVIEQDHTEGQKSVDMAGWYESVTDSMIKEQDKLIKKTLIWKD